MLQSLVLTKTCPWKAVSLVLCLLMLPSLVMADASEAVGTSLPVLKAVAVDAQTAADYEGLLRFGCSLGCAIGWEFDASSSLPAQGGNFYSPSNLGDYSLSSAWVEGVKGYGVGEKITITIKGSPDQKDIPFTGLDVVNGYAKSRQAWQANSRVKTLKLVHNGQPRFLIHLLDTRTPQSVALPGMRVSGGDILTLEIVEVFPGDKYQDTAISEINLYGAH